MGQPDDRTAVSAAPVHSGSGGGQRDDHVIRDSGLINRISQLLGMNLQLGLMYNGKGIVLMNLWFNIPFATMLMAAALSKIPDSTIEAARDAGSRAVPDLKADDPAPDLPGSFRGGHLCVHEQYQLLHNAVFTWTGVIPSDGNFPVHPSSTTATMKRRRPCR